MGSPSRSDLAPAPGTAGSDHVPNMSHTPEYEYELAGALEQELFDDDDVAQYEQQPNLPRTQNPSAHQPPTVSDFFGQDWAEEISEMEARLARRPVSSNAGLSLGSTFINTPRTAFSHLTTGSAKRSRDKFENPDSNTMPRTLVDKGALAVMLYRRTVPDPEANDIWPEFRSTAKLPVRYCLLNKDTPPSPVSRTKRRLPNIGKKRTGKGKQTDNDEEVPAGRPKWNLPVELVELIAGYLDRDDIKSLRMVSQELNHYVSQVVFQTVVVPFNTEIYGMLSQSQKPDLKGKKGIKREKPGYFWKNTNGDEVYNGHGLDVFKGFGRHILRYGMSFEVNEDSLSQPPVKSLTEKKMSFWGNYDWPFEEYRRFDAVAGLETAADETPRMKIAFAELTRIKELALSVDSGLGWLNGPDRSIRARILQQPPSVFGTLKNVPDRRAQAQRELWRHIESRHQTAGEDIKLATLYRLDGIRALSEAEETCMLAEEQPEMPYMDAHIIHGATPHAIADMPLPTSFDDPEVLNRFVLSPLCSGTGILFSSILPPTDAAQVMNPIIPANLTKAQKEWLLETEWAQRAFMSSYMLSVIDNPVTFTPVHTLNISRLSDRYLSMLNRADFWEALPNLTNFTLMVIPGWRTVHKDEAGFVDTPRINPITGLDPFCDTLNTYIANRPGLKSLTIGWIGGGEHADGLHARNKLLMPAPVLSLGLNADMVTELDPRLLRTALLQFPYVERLTLKNCWMTPAALLQFVQIHDAKKLKNLILDSVSLTAVLRPNGNPAQVVQPGGALNMPMPPAAAGAGGLFMAPNNNNPGGQGANQAQAQPLPNTNQLLQTIANSLQIQLQHLQQMQVNAGGVHQQHVGVLHAQLQFQMQNLHAQMQQQAQIQHHQHQVQLQQQIHHHQQAQSHMQGPIQAQNPAVQNAQVQTQVAASLQAVTALAAQVQMMHQQIVAVVPPLANYQPPANLQSLLQDAPREGSWMSIIDMISPGTNLGDFGSEHSKADADRQTSLQSIEFVSCGYARLPHATFDQAGVDRGNRFAATLSSTVFSKRHTALAPAMMGTKWTHLGEIVQEVDPAELAGLDVGWNLKTGWEDAEEARAVEFDGLFPGGTGRFTGKVQVSDRVRDGNEAGDAS
jgi:hypothetical protein